MREFEPTIQETPESAERKRLAELEQRYNRLYEWAKDQRFVTVYRAEGDPNWKVDRSLSTQLVGTWYTDRYSLIEARYKPEIEDLSEMPARVFALIVPQSLLDERDAHDKGMAQVNVLNEELRAGRQEITDTAEATEPTLDNYLNQFAFVREYKSLKEKYSE